MVARPGREIAKEYRDIVNYQIDHHGWRYDASGKGYPRLHPGDRAQPPISIPKTPSSRHSLAVFARKVRQRGGTWPPKED
ncbi:MAG: hypothetical protein GEV04_19790 [Actinophytocola sp.]|nr:hypothetical protein [Actinophytocola sp.]